MWQKVTYQGSDDCAQVEDHPEPGNIFPLGFLPGVGHHDRALSAPEKSSASTKEGPSEDEESRVLSMVVAKESRGVDTVSQSTEAQSQLDSESVRDGPGKKAHY